MVEIHLGRLDQQDSFLSFPFILSGLQKIYFTVTHELTALNYFPCCCGAHYEHYEQRIDMVLM